MKSEKLPSAEVKGASVNEADRKTKAEADRKAKEEVDRKTKAEADRKAKEEVDRKTKAEADRKAKEEVDRKTKAEADRKAKEEVDRKTKAEADRKAKEEVDRKTKAEADRKAKEEVDRKTKAEADRKAKEEVDRKTKAEADRKAKEEVDRKTKAEADRKAKEVNTTKVERVTLQDRRSNHVARLWQDRVDAEARKAEKEHVKHTKKVRRESVLVPGSFDHVTLEERQIIYATLRSIANLNVAQPKQNATRFGSRDDWIARFGELRLEDVGGEGDCQFRTLAALIYNDPEKFQLVRQQIAAYMRSNPNEFNEAHWDSQSRKKDNDGNSVSKFDSLDSYCDALEKNEWGTFHTLRTASMLYKCAIQVLSSANGGCKFPLIDNPTPTHPVPLVIAHYDEFHFVLVRVAKDFPVAAGQEHLAAEMERLRVRQQELEKQLVEELELRKLKKNLQRQEKLIQMRSDYERLQRALKEKLMNERAVLAKKAKDEAADLADALNVVNEEIEFREMGPSPEWDDSAGWQPSVTATVMRITQNRPNDQLTLPPFHPTIVETVSVSIRTRPFGLGSQRYAYHMKFKGDKWVAKRFKSSAHCRDESRNVYQMHIANVARILAEEFNKAMPRDVVCKRLEYLETVVLQSSLDGRPTYWMAEKFVDQELVKWNNNNGHVAQSMGFTAQAFSHFTYEFTNKKLMIVDVQGFAKGDQYYLTDPAIHTTDNCSWFGSTNLHTLGMNNFFATHMCNSICQRLQLSTGRSIGLTGHDTVVIHE